jgi:hypothetical protein
MDLQALQRAGAATRPALEPFADELRRRFDARYDRARQMADEIAAGARDPLTGRTADAVRRAEGRGNSRGTFQCWECHLVGTVLSPVDTCRSCGYSHGGINHRAVSVT